MLNVDGGVNLESLGEATRAVANFPARRWSPKTGTRPVTENKPSNSHNVNVPSGHGRPSSAPTGRGSIHAPNAGLITFPHFKAAVKALAPDLSDAVSPSYLGRQGRIPSQLCVGPVGNLRVV